MPASRAPWWRYIIASSFLGFFALQVYTYLWGGEWIGFASNYSTGSMIVRRVFPNRAGARAGLRAGDRIVAVDGNSLIPKMGRYGWTAFWANFEVGRPIRLDVDREGKQIELTRNLGYGNPRDLPWHDRQNIANEVFTLVLALLIAFRRPYDPVARIGAWLLASSVFSMLPLAYGWASLWRRRCYLPFTSGIGVLRLRDFAPPRF